MRLADFGLFLRRFQTLLGPLALGDVETGTDEAQKSAVGRKARNAGIEHPAVFAVEAAQPVFHLKRLARVDRRAVSAKAALAVFGMKTFDPVPAADLVPAPAGEFEPFAIEIDAFAFFVGHPKDVGRAVGNGPELLHRGAGVLAAARGVNGKHAQHHRADRKQEGNRQDDELGGHFGGKRVVTEKNARGIARLGDAEPQYDHRKEDGKPARFLVKPDQQPEGENRRGGFEQERENKDGCKGHENPDQKSWFRCRPGTEPSTHNGLIAVPTK